MSGKIRQRVSYLIGNEIMSVKLHTIVMQASWLLALGTEVKSEASFGLEGRTSHTALPRVIVHNKTVNAELHC